MISNVEQGSERKSGAGEYGNATGATETSAADFGGHPASASCEAKAEVTRDSVRFDVLRSAFYNSARHDHYARAHRWIMFAVVAFGTAGVGNFLLAIKIDQVALAATTAILATIDLVLDLRGKAELHGRLKQQFFALLAKIERNREPSTKQVCEWQAEFIELTALEPTEFRAVNAIAYNDAVDALGRDPKKEKLKWYHRLFGSYFSFRGHDFGKSDED